MRYRVATTYWVGRNTTQDDYETEADSIAEVLDEFEGSYDFRGADYICLEIQTKKVKYGSS